ncbi:MAG: BatA domain-containing protein [Bacteroidia bacterium]
MQFINPTFLYALGFLTIPIVIHLFNFRRPKKLVFSDIRFLKQILLQNKKQRQVKHYLILLLRILALAALIFAFANPFIPKGKEAIQSDAAVMIYIDNSFSMNANGKEAELLEEAKNKARTIINSYSDGHSFQILSNDFESKHRLQYAKKDILGLLDEIKISAASKSFNQILARQKSQTEKGTIPYWISDGQSAQFKISEYKPDSNIQINFIPLQAQNTANIWIDTVWITDPIVKKNQVFKIKTVLKNGSENDVENQSVSLMMDGAQKAIQTFSCKAGSSETIEFELQLNDGNWHQASVKIVDYPISFDDEYYFTFKVADRVNILQVYDGNPNPAFTQLYQLDETYQLKKAQLQSLKYSELNLYNLVILDGLKNISTGLFVELERFAKEGGIVMVLPSTEATIQYEAISALGFQLSSLKNGKYLVNQVEVNDPLFRGVFSSLNEQTAYPEITKCWSFDYASNAGIKPILKNNDGSLFLARKSWGKGQFYLAANELNASSGNFSQHAFFVPLFLQLPFQIKLRLPWSFQLAKTNAVPVFEKTTDQVLQLKRNKEEWLCETENKEGNNFANIPNELQQAGFYQLGSKSNATLAVLAFNYPRTESQLKFISEETFKEKGIQLLDEDDKQLGLSIQMQDNGISLWRYFLLAALLFFLLEMLLLRRKV